VRILRKLPERVFVEEEVEKKGESYPDRTPNCRLSKTDRMGLPMKNSEVKTQQN
jgi:repressor of nif and glnA expression